MDFEIKSSFHYRDVIPSILACSVERWTGFREMPSSAAGQVVRHLAEIDQARIEGRTW
jgi:outer membrane lipopolysaccharide assembly protein LptE/RlpB